MRLNDALPNHHYRTLVRDGLAWLAMRSGAPIVPVVCVGTGAGSTMSWISVASAAICAALFGGNGRDWVGRGSGIDDSGLIRKAEAVDAGLAANPSARQDPLEALRCLGGREIAGMTGATILAAGLARVGFLDSVFSRPLKACVESMCWPCA